MFFTKINFNNCSRGFFNPLSKLEQEKLANKKIILFENCVDYIFSYKLAAPKLIFEILGLSSTKCEDLATFKINKNFNNLFFKEEITRETTYFICLCYIKEKYSQNQLEQFEGFNLNYEIIKKWLEKEIYLDINIIYKINKSYIFEVKISNKLIIFSQYYPSIKLIKISKYLNNLNQINYTKKPLKLNLKELYNNSDGKCLGATNYWLLSMAKSYNEPNQLRQNIKNNYLISLSLVPEINNLHKPKKIITDQSTRLIINNFYKTGLNINQFVHVQDIYSTNKTITNEVMSLLNLMTLNKLEQLYIQIVTHDHVMGIIIIVKGNLRKLLFYDPGSEKTYSSILFNPNELDKKQIDLFFTNAPYFTEERNNRLVIVLKCYFFKNNYNKFIKTIDTNLNLISEIKEEEDLTQLLQLGIVAKEKMLILIVFNANKYTKNSLILAVRNGNKNMVEFILHYKLDILNEVEDGYTALGHAILFDDLVMVNLLLKFGAKIILQTFNNTISHLKIALDQTISGQAINMDIYNILKETFEKGI